MEQHYQEDLSLDELAEILTVNASYLSYIFKKETGSTVVQYLTSLRMEQACRLLKNRPDRSHPRGNRSPERLQLHHLFS